MVDHPGLIVELVPMVIRGDMILDTPLAKVGGRGLFVKEPEVVLLEKHTDIAVYSMKDAPAEFPGGLGPVTTCKRGGPRDAFVSNKYNSLNGPPAGSIVGTSNLRRQCQLAKRRPDFVTHSLHDNVGARLSKLNNGDYDAIILAVTGLERLDLESRVRTALPPKTFLSIVGRDAVGIKYWSDDMRTQVLLAPLNHEEAALRVKAERAMNTRLGGGCQVPIGSYAGIIGGEIWLYALVGAPDGLQMVCGERHGATQDAEQIGISLAGELLEDGIRVTLAEVYNGETPT